VHVSDKVNSLVKRTIWDFFLFLRYTNVFRIIFIIIIIIRSIILLPWFNSVSVRVHQRKRMVSKAAQRDLTAFIA